MYVIEKKKKEIKKEKKERKKLGILITSTCAMIFIQFKIKKKKNDETIIWNI